MPRRSRSRSGTSGFQRSSPTPQRHNNVPQQTSKVPAPHSNSGLSATQGRQPGLFANMASTAAGVAIGSTVVSNFLLF